MLGIGQYTALAFARHGITRLALADINLPALQAANASLKAKYPSIDVLELAMDVGDKDQVRAGIRKLVKTFGRLDVAVNNAGIGGSGRKTHEIDEGEFTRVVNVDLHGVWRCQKAELEIMTNQE
jgi:NAD(P)-dependent dehydrogenase (short-subunit alcohol dehydrogenase family)